MENKNGLTIMNRVDEDLLGKVTGGESRNRTLCLVVDLPQTDSSIKVSVYFDGVFSHSQVVQTTYLQRITLSFSASGGMHTVNVNIEDLPYKQYELDFDNVIIR